MNGLRWLLVPLLVVFAGIAAWQYLTGYSRATYRCQGPAEWHLTHPPVPVIGRFLFVDSLEVHIGGWIERGTLTISGDIGHTPLEVTAGDRPTMIAFARLGEWYEEDFTVNFAPSKDASCVVRVVYRFRGVF